MTQAVAERLIYGIVNDVEAKVTVRVWSPERDEKGASFCRYTFHSSNVVINLKDGAGYGVDDMQALIQALQGVGGALDRSEIEWSMFSKEETEAEDSNGIREDGFPRVGLSVMFYGADFRKRMESYVEGEKLAAMKLLPKPKRRPPLRLA